MRGKRRVSLPWAGMLIEDSFTVRTPIDRLWTLLQDVQRIAPCLPGAELTETVDERTWRGVVHVRLGPVQLAFRGTVVMEERDDTAHRAKLSAKGTEQRGKGAATATVESWLEPAEDGATTVRLRSQITLTGPAAQLSRGLLPEVSRLLTGQFAGCLQEMLEADAGPPPGEAEAEPAPPSAPRALAGFGLGLRALWSAITRFVRRLLGRRPP
jgi:carbon monoxide dehydrogenase subunit G